MTALLEAPAGPPETGTAPRRRPRGGLALAAVVALVGLAATVLLVWAPTTLDLAVGRTGFAGGTEVTPVPGYGDRGTDIVGYRHGAAVEIAVPVRNDGPLPVTVEDVSTGAGVLPLLEVREVKGLPLRLAPGGSGEVVLSAVLTNCAHYHERQVQNVDALQLAVRPALPLAGERTVLLPLERPLLVRSPMIVGCPDRTLDRNDDHRTDAL